MKALKIWSVALGLAMLPSMSAVEATERGAAAAGSCSECYPSQGQWCYFRYATGVERCAATISQCSLQQATDGFCL